MLKLQSNCDIYSRLVFDVRASFLCGCLLFMHGQKPRTKVVQVLLGAIKPVVLDRCEGDVGIAKLAWTD